MRYLWKYSTVRIFALVFLGVHIYFKQFQLTLWTYWTKTSEIMKNFVLILYIKLNVHVIIY